MKCEYGKKLADFTTLKIGGKAYCWFEPEKFKDVIDVIKTAADINKPLMVLGKGSNILIPDEGFDGVVINLSKGFDYILKEGDTVLSIGGAAKLSKLVEHSLKWHLTGCEFLVGLPGTLGGAVFMNAGVRDLKDTALQREIKDIIVEVDLIDLKDGKRKILKTEEVPFQYRSSGLVDVCILSAKIKLAKADKDHIRDQISCFIQKRQWMQAKISRSAGSVFKNPEGEYSAGQLIELCKLKGKRIGGAEISNAHANFIVNVDNAASKDVLDLIKLAKNRVKEKFGIDLELELTEVKCEKK